MTPTECPRELEVLECVTAGRWPDGCDTELRAHATSCAICADIVEAAGALSEEMNIALHEAHVPTSGVVWWRMQRRMREETLRAASRAITVVQAASIAGAVLVALTILGGISATRETWSEWVAHVHFGEMSAIYAQWTSPLLFAAAAGLALASVAMYFVFAED